MEVVPQYQAGSVEKDPNCEFPRLHPGKCKGPLENSLPGSNYLMGSGGRGVAREGGYLVKAIVKRGA
jgi:hypothetical protein